MSASGYTPIQIYYSTTAAAVPVNTNLLNGELAINITDGKLYYKNNSGVVTLLAGSTGSGPAGGSNTQVQYNSSGILAGSSTFTYNGTTVTVPQLTDSGLTSGRITYAGTGGLLQDSASLVFTGNLGLGTASPSTIFQISTGTPVVTVTSTGTTASSQNFTTNSAAQRATVGVEQSTGGGLFVGSSAYAAVFGSAGASNTQFATNNNVRVTIDTSGNLGIGVTSPACILDISGSTGGQIKFPATQNASSDANTLDDYEEGTWTPSLGGTTTYTQQVGEYTKIGNLVYLRATLQINVLGTGSTTAIFGLPFNGTNKRASGSCGFYSTTAVNVNQLIPVVNTNNISFVSSPAAGTGVTDAPAIFGDGAFIFITVTYQI